MLACASAAVFAWTQRDKVSNWPGLVEAAGAEYYVTLARNNLEGVRALLQVAKLPQPAPADKAMCETVEA